METQNRETGILINPDEGFIKESVIDLKKIGICYAYNKEQVEKIQKLYRQRYHKETTYKFDDWYYIIRICK